MSKHEVTGYRYWDGKVILYLDEPVPADPKDAEIAELKARVGRVLRAYHAAGDLEAADNALYDTDRDHGATVREYKVARDAWADANRALHPGDPEVSGMSELKPCPFCGGPAVTLRAAGSARWVCRCIAMGKCGVIGPYGDSQKEAEARWNRRWQAPMEIDPLPGIDKGVTE